MTRVLAQLDALNEANANVTEILLWTREPQEWASARLQWIAIRMWIVPGPPRHVYLLGPWGDIADASPGTLDEEKIDESPEGPSGHGELRDLRWIGKHLYAAGMSRQVYRRLGKRRWEHVDEGILTPRGSMEVVGFNAIDGLSETDFFGVGFGGEIWRFLKDRWVPIDSPTNVVLHRVRVIEKDLAYACGQKGTILRGRGDRWEVVKHELKLADLWGMEWYRDQLYVATDTDVYRLTEGDQLERVALVKQGDVTARHLHANDGVMWSFGSKNLFWTEDGQKWREATPREGD